MSTSATRVESSSTAGAGASPPSEVVLSSNPQMDLAPRGPSVVQLRPVRPSVFSKVGLPNTGVSGGGGGVTPIISVNRSTGVPITLLPARLPAVGVPLNLVQPGGNTHHQGQINTYQITRVRPGGAPSPASITVTPLQASK
jgi:hypothetical protein